MLQKTPLPALYLSAEDLGITTREREGLIDVRNDLASGRVKHAPQVVMDDRAEDPQATGFNMSLYFARGDCGSVQCIAGFMQARGVWPFVLAFSENLCPLFYGEGAGRNGLLTPAQAVQAIDYFLTGAGYECWPLALQDIPLSAE